MEMPLKSVDTCMHAQSCLTFCDPMDCSPPGSPSMEFSRQECWSGWPFPSAEDLPDPGVEPESLACPTLAHMQDTSGKNYHCHGCYEDMKFTCSVIFPHASHFSPLQEKIWNICFMFCKLSFLTFSLFSRCLITVHNNCPHLDPIMLFFPLITLFGHVIVPIFITLYYFTLQHYVNGSISNVACEFF